MGLDLGSSSIKGVVCDGAGGVVWAQAAAHQMQNGMPMPQNILCDWPPRWIEALERLLAALPRPLAARIRCISGGAQQHGTERVRMAVPEALQGWRPRTKPPAPG